MTPTKQTQLDQCLAIANASFEYLLSLENNRVILDAQDPIAEMYQKYQADINTFYQQGKLSKLNQALLKRIKHFSIENYDRYTAFVKSQTGITIEQDYFKWLPTNSDAEAEQELIAKYAVTDIHAPENSNFSSITHSTKLGNKEIKHVLSSNGPKLHHYEVKTFPSPDGLKQIQISQLIQGKIPTTSVAINLLDNKAKVFEKEMLDNNIQVTWKDNQTVQITTNLEKLRVQHFDLRCQDQLIRIEYL